MPFICKRQTTAQNVHGETQNYMPGDVLSDWELSDHIRKQIEEGSSWFLQSFEPISEREAHSHRVKATQAEGPRVGEDGKPIDPPWDDYVGLHPTEICNRLAQEDHGRVTQVRAYERAGLNREPIMNYVAPVEREPWVGYNEDGVREILERLSRLDDTSVQQVIVYEMNHQKRPAIISYEKETYEPQSEGSDAGGDPTNGAPAAAPVTTGVGA